MLRDLYYMARLYEINQRLMRIENFKANVPIKDLLKKQSKNEFLTKDEKDRILLYAEQKRKQNLVKKSKK